MFTDELVKYYMYFESLKPLNPVGVDDLSILSGSQICNSQNGLANTEKRKKNERWKGSDAVIVCLANNWM